MLLLNSEMKVNLSVDIEFRYDNGSIKEVTVTKGDYVLVKFWHNGNKYDRVAKVKEILYKAIEPTKYDIVFIFDTAADYSSSRFQVMSARILAMRVLTEEVAIEASHKWGTFKIVDKCYDDGVDIFDPDKVEEIDPIVPIDPEPSDPDNNGNESTDEDKEPPIEDSDDTQEPPIDNTPVVE